MLCDIAYIWDLKKKKVQMNLFTKQKSHLLKTNLWVPEVGGSENLGDCG